MRPDAIGPTAVLGGRVLAFSETAQRILAMAPDAAEAPAFSEEGPPPSPPGHGTRRHGRAPAHGPFRGPVLRRSIGGLRTELRTDGSAERRLRDLLAGFPAFAPGTPVDMRLTIRKAGTGMRITDADGTATRADAVSLVPTVKALMTERILETGDHLVALHCAVVGTPRGTTLLVGAPGAGKSTLAAACMSAGLPVRCDDLALLRADGRVAPVPFALTLKPGAWTTVSALLPQLAGKPIHCRADGRRVRYLPLRGASDRPETVARIVLPERGAPGPALVPVDPVTVLAEVLEGAHRPNGRLDAAGFAALTAMIDGAETFVLTGADAHRGAALLAA